MINFSLNFVRCSQTTTQTLARWISGGTHSTSMLSILVTRRLNYFKISDFRNCCCCLCRLNFCLLCAPRYFGNFFFNVVKVGVVCFFFLLHSICASSISFVAARYSAIGIYSVPLSVCLPVCVCMCLVVWSFTRSLSIYLSCFILYIFLVILCLCCGPSPPLLLSVWNDKPLSFGWFSYLRLSSRN